MGSVGSKEEAERAAAETTTAATQEETKQNDLTAADHTNDAIALSSPNNEASAVGDNFSPASLAGGLTRAIIYGFKQMGLTGTVMHRVLTKQAFLHIAKRSNLHAASASPLRSITRA
jgi:hypothetical protein